MAFEDLKKSQSIAWGSGPFEEIEKYIADMHDAIVESLAPGGPKHWLDIGCGTGGVTNRAASQSGAEVVGVDLSPGMIETARRLSAEAGFRIAYEVGDCEQLPFADGTFDAVSSSVGLIFAPDHEAVAAELARITAPGGRIALTAWRPDGGVGRFFKFMSAYQPEPAEGAGNPLRWGTEEYAGRMLGDDFELGFEERDTPFVIESGEKVWDLFSHAFGPTRTLVDSMNDEEVAKFRDAFIDFAEEDRDGGMIRQSRTYLLITGTRKSG